MLKQFWGEMIGYNGSTDFNEINIVTKKIDDGINVGVDKHDFGALIRALSWFYF